MNKQPTVSVRLTLAEANHLVRCLGRVHGIDIFDNAEARFLKDKLHLATQVLDERTPKAHLVTIRMPS